MTESRMNYKKVVIPLLILIGSSVLLGIMFFNSGLITISHGSEGEGYFSFQILDTDTGLYKEGQVLITNFETGESVGIFDTNESIYTDISIIATLYNISLDISDTREFLPITIIPLVEGTPNEPIENTIPAYFYFPTENVSVDIVRVDDVIAPFDISSITPDILHEIELDFDVEIGNQYSTYGPSSYVPEDMLPPLSKANDIMGFGLWFFLNNTEVLPSSTIVQGYEANSYYIASHDFSVILLDPVWFGGQYQNQTVSFECTQQPTNVGVFQGFIDDIQRTFVEIS
ncbi:MAG: hypothetical protein ACFFAS_06925 [Promethearchaeota archaeon]